MRSYDKSIGKLICTAVIEMAVFLFLTLMIPMTKGGFITWENLHVYSLDQAMHVIIMIQVAIFLTFSFKIYKAFSQRLTFAENELEIGKNKKMLSIPYANIKSVVVLFDPRGNIKKLMIEKTKGVLLLSYYKKMSEISQHLIEKVTPYRATVIKKIDGSSKLWFLLATLILSDMLTSVSIIHRFLFVIPIYSFLLAIYMIFASPLALSKSPFPKKGRSLRILEFALVAIFLALSIVFLVGVIYWFRGVDLFGLLQS